MGPNPILVNTIAPIGLYAYNFSDCLNIDTVGRIYVTDYINQRIHVYNMDDSIYAIPTFSTGVSIEGIALDSYNNVYVGAGSLRSFTSIDAGPPFIFQGSYGSVNEGIKYDPYNNLLYASSNTANAYIYKSNGGVPNLLNQANIPASFSMNAGTPCDMVYNPFNSMIYASNLASLGVEIHNPSNNYLYTGTTLGNSWGLSGYMFIDVEPISGYLYLDDTFAYRLHTFSPIGTNHGSISLGVENQGIRLNNKNGKIYTANNRFNSIYVYFDPFAWTAPGTTYLASLPLNQNLTLNAGYNLTMTGGTMGAQAGNNVSPISLNAGSTLTLAGGTLTPDINQGIVMNTGTLVDQFNSTLNFPMRIIAPSTITSNGGNTLKLAGTTTINNTSLTLNGAGITKITGNITGTGTLNVNGNINFANTVMFGGSINLSSGTPSLTANQIWGSIQGSAPLTMNNYMITLGADNTNQTYSGSLTGTGVIYKNGTGIQTFTGNLSGFTGMIVVSHGEVIINSSTPFGGKIINESTINTKNNTVINGDFNSSGTFIVG
jgi:autotransporter-associated beta strand protein